MVSRLLSITEAKRRDVPQNYSCDDENENGVCQVMLLKDECADAPHHEHVRVRDSNCFQNAIAFAVKA